ncbi:hypothetical protein FRX31_011611, partial [Thalictrum thalictroides]
TVGELETNEIVVNSPPITRPCQELPNISTNYVVDTSNRSHLFQKSCGLSQQPSWNSNQMTNPSNVYHISQVANGLNQPHMHANQLSPNKHIYTSPYLTGYPTMYGINGVFQQTHGMHNNQSNLLSNCQDNNSSFPSRNYSLPVNFMPNYHDASSFQAHDPPGPIKRLEF